MIVNKEVSRYKFFLTLASFMLCCSFSQAHAQAIFPNYTTYSLPSQAEASAIGDVNGDGLNDVAVVTGYAPDANDRNKLFIFLQDVDGRLQDSVQYDSSQQNSFTTVDIGDVNDDGKNDVVVGDSARNGYIYVFLQNNSGNLDSPITIAGNNTFKIRIGDFNNDGLLDVATVGSELDVFLQDANGNLIFDQQYILSNNVYDDLAVGDVNNDSLDDIVVLTGQDPDNNIAVMLQNDIGTLDGPFYYGLGNNKFTEGVAVGDVNGDSLNDVVVTYGGNRPASMIAAFYQNAYGTLDPPISFTSYDIPTGIGSRDINFDGGDDIALFHGSWRKLGVYLQDNQTLMDEDLYDIPLIQNRNAHAISIGDINNDNMNDITIADGYYGLVILQNALKAPIPDIKANGEDDKIIITQSDPLEITISLDAGDFAGENRDLFIKGDDVSKGVTYWYLIDYNKWIKSENPIPATDQPLSNFALLTIADLDTVPAGLYRVGFSVDSNFDQKRDVIINDEVVIQVLPAQTVTSQYSINIFE